MSGASQRPRGFARMAPERIRALGRLGGVSAHARGVAYEFDSESGRVAREARRLKEVVKSSESKEEVCASSSSTSPEA